MLVVEKTEWEDGETDYNVSVQDSCYSPTTLHYEAD